MTITADEAGGTPPDGQPFLASPTQTRIRSMLEDAVRMELLGPAGGLEEELEESPRDRYLVGFLAPKKQRVRREEQDELAEGGSDSSEEGAAEPSTPAAVTLLPSSFGFSCCVTADTNAIKVTARWGRYQRQASSTALGDDGSPKNVWRRAPVVGVIPALPLAEGAVEPQPLSSDYPDVLLRGRIRRSDGGWVVTLFLVNEQEGERKGRGAGASAWLFQPELVAEASDGAACFQSRSARSEQGRLDAETWAELRTSAMLYRKSVEFAVGHGVAVHVDTSEEKRTRAVRIATAVIPGYEVPPESGPTFKEAPALERLPLDMSLIAEIPDGAFLERLGPLTDAYQAWLKAEEARLQAGEDDLGDFQDVGQEALDRCGRALARMQEGLALLDRDTQAASAFRFANKAMALQRVRSKYALKRRRGEKVEVESLDLPENRSWRLFQLAFFLLNLPSLTDPLHPDRSHPSDAVADLLWFPTGGGKTEAYLGLAAYAMALRRLQGALGGRAGNAGMAVLMRYTLRLLTLQQFQRAAALVCACESLRIEARATGDASWGEEPFRIGLWVGQKTTPNWTEDSAEAIQRIRGQGAGPGARIGTPLQLTSCPWCGSAIEPGRDVTVDRFEQGVGRTFIYCGDSLGRCPFTRRVSPREGIPIVVVDEEIYRRLPSMVISTVDKFAQLPWNGATAVLFGQVTGYCPRHGFRSPDLDDSDSHPQKGALPPVKTEETLLLRPPDLIIQDELHLISGPLGTLVGLYETVVDELCTWELDGHRIRPKVVASTATIRRASQQVRSLFLRRVEVFPPPALDIESNFFSRRREPTEDRPGRRYLGICAPGIRMKAAHIRAYLAFLAAAQQLYERYGRAVDPWMTLVGYFNSMRELGGMRRLVEDDVRSRLKAMPKRGLSSRRAPILEELTSRLSSSDIPRVLDMLERPFDPEDDRKRDERKGKGGMPLPLDVLLATNMISVGVDVERLGLLIAAGQPKTTAEYIQATSRVGRTFPGLVCTVYNWARPRDLSHYETFEHYHATFYQHVEALSVTPFAPRALDRGLTALLVSMVRLAEASLNPNSAAQALTDGHPLIQRAVDAIASRAQRVDGDGAEAMVRGMLQRRVQAWLRRIRELQAPARLGYRPRRDGLTLGLLERAGIGEWTDMTVLNSLRDVEPGVGLILIEGAVQAPVEKEERA